MTSWRELVDQGVIVCPADHGKLDSGADTLTCATCSRVYRIEDDIPVLLISEAQAKTSDIG